MPTLFRFLLVLGTIGGVVAGSLYALAEYFQPEPKEISKALRNVKAIPFDEIGTTDPNEGATSATTSESQAAQ
jgi:hypothetical protein